MTRSIFSLLILTLALLVFHIQPARALDIKTVRFGVHSDKIRMVIELNENTQFSAFMLPEIKNKPYRLVIDMPDFNWQAGTIQRPANTGVLDVRSGVLSQGTKRLVVDLDRPVKILNAFILPPSNNTPYRLVVDYTSINQDKFLTTPRNSFGKFTPFNPGNNNVVSENEKSDAPVIPTRKPEAILPKSLGTLQSQQPPASPLRKPLIVIDAGHGGEDPGAIGAEKQREKNVTLAAAKTLKNKLESTGRYRVHLTRDKDFFIKLGRRVSIAREKEADLFISLHADSIGKSEVSGASIYTLSNKASDAQTAKLAQRENQADLIAGVDLSHEDKDVANILIDLAMRDTMNQSKFFANSVVNSMKNHGVEILPHTHRFAGFAVLKAPDIPSVLLEMGFMSNKNEARLLSSSAYQEKIATAVTSAIDGYFQKVNKNNQ